MTKGSKGKRGKESEGERERNKKEGRVASTI
jgi:hypothetical protein